MDGMECTWPRQKPSSTVRGNPALVTVSSGVSELVVNWDTTALERLLGSPPANAVKHSIADLPDGHPSTF